MAPGKGTIPRLIAVVVVMASALAAAQPSAATSDAQLLAVADLVPEFGGVFFDDFGEPTVFLVGGAELILAGGEEEERAARQVAGALAEVFGPGFTSQVRRQIDDDEGLHDYFDYGGDYWQDDDSGAATAGGNGSSGLDLRIEDARYSMWELDDFRRRVRGALAGPGVAYTDLDEGRNRVTLGVAPWMDAEEVEARLRDTGVPMDAIHLQPAEDFEEQQGTALRKKTRPAPGGVQISNGNDFCTLGFNAVLEGLEGFVASSHCTRRRGELDGTAVGGPKRRNRLGVEAADPRPLPGIPGCPGGRRCRMSDAAFFAYDGTEIGSGIARTASLNKGSLDVDQASPVMEIGPGPPAVAVGTLVEKVGRTTGWTRGRVSQTCVDVNLPGSDITYLCQTIVRRLAGVAQPYSGGGDSGAPVFVREGPGPVALAGIHWGGTRDGDMGVFSPIVNVRQDLGELEVA